MVKVEFIWSWIYQSSVLSLTTKEKYDFETYDSYVREFIVMVQKEWIKNGDNILKYCENITGLIWKKDIRCYVAKIANIHPISDPLTIPIQIEMNGKAFTLSVERYIDMVIHELIHNLFIQNEQEIGDYFDKIMKKYLDEEFDTIIHLLLHAIHKKIFLRFFDEKRLKEEKDMCEYYPTYKRSWEIVERCGEDTIIKEFRSYISKSGLPKANA